MTTIRASRRNHIQVLHDEGLSQRRIAARLGISEITVRREFRELGIPPKPGARPQYTTSVANRAVELYLSGLSMSAVERALGIDDQSVRRILDERGVPRRPQSIRPQYDASIKAKAVTLYLRRKSAAAVGEQLGLRSHTVKAWVGKRMRSMSEAARLRCGTLPTTQE